MNAPNRSPQSEVPTAQSHTRGGFWLGLAAYGLWGVLPLYFKAVADVAAVDIVAHRILWSLPFLALLITVARGWPSVRAAVGQPKTIGVLTLTALLIGGNWLLYVYAVTSGHILAASFDNNGKRYFAYRYTHPNGKTEYVDQNGLQQIHVPSPAKRICARLSEVRGNRHSSVCICMFQRTTLANRHGGRRPAIISMWPGSMVSCRAPMTRVGTSIEASSAVRSQWARLASALMPFLLLFASVWLFPLMAALVAGDEDEPDGRGQSFPRVGLGRELFLAGAGELVRPGCGREVDRLPDPVGEVIREWNSANGLRIAKVRVPIGVVGIIYEAMGFRPEMFTVLFAIPRMSGWLAQWEEMLLDPEQKIARPRQIYIGEPERSFVAMEDR